MGELGAWRKLARAQLRAGVECGFHTEHDPVTLEPRGTRCTRPAVQALLWHDGRWSASCVEHGLVALTDEARLLVRATEGPR